MKSSIGISYTFVHLLNNEEWLECIPCDISYTLKSILIDCIDVTDIRQTLNTSSELLTNVTGDIILKF